ncbi:MAG TPA: adenosylmethionine--8-amino-7-oxononanoate transaminase [Gemmatimonadales bacterium]|nr:adenosylmethionine--8-amino-7-oxononanoate transaminase [Gemmatimonadales bacterium]
MSDTREAGSERREASRSDSSLASRFSLLDADALHALDRQHVWHPFTPHSVYADEQPLMIVAGDGHDLIDADGTRYLDGVASLWCNAFGHRNPRIDAAITAQLGRIAHATFLGNASAPAVELAARLVAMTPAALTRVFFSDNGSTATEIAMKMAYQFWQQTDNPADRKRTRFVTLGEAYHGDTIGAVSLGGIELFHEIYRPLLFETIRLPSPHRYRCPMGASSEDCGERCTQEAERIIAEHADEIAAVMIEPGVQGAAGMITQPHGYAKRLREATRDAGALFIADEVAVGWGRSGARFASELLDLDPDILCLAKGLTGGYLPLAATLTTERLFEGFLGPPEAGRTFFHGHTYTGNALGAAAALASADLLDDVLPTLRITIEHFAGRAESLRPLPHVGDIRRFGLALGVELVADITTRTPYPAAARIGMQVTMACKRRGVFLRPLGDTIVVMPPLTITCAELDTLFDALDASIREVCSA